MNAESVSSILQLLVAGSIYSHHWFGVVMPPHLLPVSPSKGSVQSPWNDCDHVSHLKQS